MTLKIIPAKGAGPIPAISIIFVTFNVLIFTLMVLDNIKELAIKVTNLRLP